MAALRWLIEAGANEAIAEEPIDRYAETASQTSFPTPSSGQSALPAARVDTPKRSWGPEPLPSPPIWAPETKPPTAPQELLEDARRLAAAAQSLQELHEAIAAFEGCSLKKSATNTVIFRGDPRSKIMLIGEAPGREEDLQGKPFVGAAGQLLDRMLTWAGLEPSKLFITNLLFWRPPGNRTPEQREIALCLPFVERQIALIQPEYLLLLGNVSTKTLLERQEGITRLRGRWFPYHHPEAKDPLPAMVMLHPAFLLRQPAQKRLAWRDLLAFQDAVSRGQLPLSE